MPHLTTCLDILRRLIAKGDPNGVPLAESHQRVFGCHSTQCPQKRSPAHPAGWFGSTERGGWSSVLLRRDSERLYRKKTLGRVRSPQLVASFDVAYWPRPCENPKRRSRNVCSCAAGWPRGAPAVTHNWRVVRFPEMRWVSSAQGQTEFMAQFLSY